MYLKRHIFIIFCFLVPFKILGQVTLAEDALRSGIDISDTIPGLKVGGLFAFNFSQSTFHNWTSGKNNSIAFNGLTSITTRYKGKNSSLEIIFDLAYGLQRLGKEKAFIKIDDKLDIAIKYGRAISKTWFYAAFANVRTQISPGYEYPLQDSIKVSDFFTPAFIIGAIGIDYRPGNGFTAFAAPLTSKTTVVNSQRLANEGAFGVEPAEFDDDDNMIKKGKLARHEVGGYTRFVFRKHVDKPKNLLILTKLDLFSNYMEKPENVDFNWELIISYKLTKYISATLSTQFIYDDDTDIYIDYDNDGETDFQGPKLQIKELIGIGFSIKL